MRMIPPRFHSCVSLRIRLLQLLTWLLSFLVAAHGVEAGTGQGDPEVERIGEPTAQVIEKLDQAQWERLRETADEILINDSEVHWHRYLRALANTPEWLDIGLAQRLRYEVLTNNFRVGQSENINGFSARSRLRVGVDWKVFRFFVEGQNSAGVDENNVLASTLNPSLVSGDRLLQAFVAVKLENVFNTGLRTDL